MDRERTRYREFTPWAPVLQAVLWGTVCLVCYPILAGWDDDLTGIGGRLLLVGAICGAFAGSSHLLGGLTVLIQDSRIFVHLGKVPLVRTAIPFRDIRSVESVRYRPLLEFGGWGLRGTRSRRAWSARGDLAVALRLADDRVVLIGSDRPRRLEERIRTLGGVALGVGQQDADS